MDSICAKKVEEFVNHFQFVKLIKASLYRNKTLQRKSNQAYNPFLKLSTCDIYEQLFV